MIGDGIPPDTGFCREEERRAGAQNSARALSHGYFGERLGLVGPASVGIAATGGMSMSKVYSPGSANKAISFSANILFFAV
jgi:hypothetical protein